LDKSCLPVLGTRDLTAASLPSAPPSHGWRSRPKPRLIERQGINMTAHVTVTVWGKHHVVTVYQKSKSEWIVAGQHKDKQIQVTDSGYNAAIKRWREAATDLDSRGSYFLTISRLAARTANRSYS
jgi:hypothetical protein